MSLYWSFKLVLFNFSQVLPQLSIYRHLLSVRSVLALSRCISSCIEEPKKMKIMSFFHSINHCNVCIAVGDRMFLEMQDFDFAQILTNLPKSNQTKQLLQH